MKKNLILPIIIVVIVLAGAVALLAKKDTKNTAMDMPKASTTSSKTESTTPNTVILKDLDFATKKLTVKKGTAVTWKNEDTAKHTVTFDDAALEGASSQLFGPGESFTYTFNTAGTFAYHCTPHPFMKAAVEVTE